MQYAASRNDTQSSLPASKATRDSFIVPERVCVLCLVRLILVLGHILEPQALPSTTREPES